MSSSLKSGSIAFKVPPKMNVDESATIELLLPIPKTPEDLENEISAAGENVGASVGVSEVIEARLTGQRI